jgi:hypothetical protein
MDLNGWVRMVTKSARLMDVVRNATDRDEGIDQLHLGIERVGLAVDRKTVSRVYDRVKAEEPAA